MPKGAARFAFRPRVAGRGHAEAISFPAASRGSGSSYRSLQNVIASSSVPGPRERLAPQAVVRPTGLALGEAERRRISGRRAIYRQEIPSPVLNPTATCSPARASTFVPPFETRLACRRCGSMPTPATLTTLSSRSLAHGSSTCLNVATLAGRNPLPSIAAFQARYGGDRMESPHPVFSARVPDRRLPIRRGSTVHLSSYSIGAVIYPHHQCSIITTEVFKIG